MSEEAGRATPTPSNGDRRTADRRQGDRRAPVPYWRRPWMLVVYGVLGTLLVVGLVNRSRPADPAATDNGIVSTRPVAPREDISPSAVAGAPAEDARGAAHLERLLAEGDVAVGRSVHAELYCGSISPVALRSVQYLEPAILDLRDVTNRVPAAECKWGSRVGDEPRGDVMLIVPPELAPIFAAAPVVDDGFVARRRIVAVVEWLGRPEALALRNAAVLREYPVVSEV